MNHKMIENAIENVFTKHLSWLESDTWYATDGDTNEQRQIVMFDRVCDTCEGIKAEIIEMLCEEEK